MAMPYIEIRNEKEPMLSDTITAATVIGCAVIYAAILVRIDQA